MQAPEHDLLELVPHFQVWSDLSKTRDVFSLVGNGEPQGIIGPKRWLSSKHRVEHTAESVDVRAMIDPRMRPGLLGCHVGWRAHVGAHSGDRRLFLRLFDKAKIQQNRPFIAVVVPLDDNVSRFHITVNQPRLVGVPEASRQASTQGHHQRRIYGTALQPLLERVAGKALHDHKEEFFLFAKVVHRDEVRMAQLGRRRSLLQETSSELGAICIVEVGAQYLDCDFSTERLLYGDIHVPGTPLSDGRDHAIATAEGRARERVRHLLVVH